MHVTRWTEAADFYAHVERFLLAHEAEHNLLLGLCTSLIHENIYRDAPYMASVELEGEVVAVAICTPPRDLVLSEMHDSYPLNPLVQDVWAVLPNLAGVNGPRPYSRNFAQYWEAASGMACRLKMTQRIFRLEQVQPVRGIPGEMHPLTTPERNMAIEWMLAFDMEALDGGLSREDAERNVDLRLKSDPLLRGMRLWWVDQRPVSMAGYGGLTPSGIRIGPVYTPPAFRGNGYASALTAALSQELLDARRKFCFLFTDLSNPTSNKIYQDIGYEPVSDVEVYAFGAADEHG